MDRDRDRGCELVSSTTTTTTTAIGLGKGNVVTWAVGCSSTRSVSKKGREGRGVEKASAGEEGEEGKVPGNFPRKNSKIFPAIFLRGASSSSSTVVSLLSFSSLLFSFFSFSFFFFSFFFFLSPFSRVCSFLRLHEDVE